MKQFTFFFFETNSTLELKEIQMFWSLIRCLRLETLEFLP